MTIKTEKNEEKNKLVFKCFVEGKNIRVDIPPHTLGNNIMQGLTMIIKSLAEQSQINVADVTREINKYASMEENKKENVYDN